MVKVRNVVWGRLARADLRSAFNYIKRDSLLQAEKVSDDLRAAIRDLPSHPHMYPADKYKKSNNGNFRAFEMHNFRISYAIINETILVLKIRHVKQEPKEY